MLTLTKKTILIVSAVYVPVSYYLYRPVFIDMKILKLFYYIMLFVIISMLFIKKKRLPLTTSFNNSLKFVVGSIAFSIIPAYLIWKQNIIITLIATLPYLGYLFYFFLLKFKLDVSRLEKVTLIISVVTTVLLINAILIYPDVLYGGNPDDEIRVDRGFARITIAGVGFIFLGFFISINKYSINGSIKWLLLGMYFLVGVFLTLTRQSIVSCLLIGVIYLLISRKKLILRILIIICFILGGILIVKLSFVDNLITETRAQSEVYNDNIRLLSAKYFLFDFSPSEFSTFFGNGEAATQKSVYGDFIKRLKDQGLYQSDVGIIGYYAKFGVIGVVAWIFIFWRAISIKLPKEYYYTKLYIIFIAITCLTSSTFFNIDYISSICITLYIADITSSKKNMFNKFQKMDYLTQVGR